MLSRQQALIRIRGIAGRKYLVAKGERSRQPPCNVGTDQRSRAPGSVLQDGSVADVLVWGDASLVGIVRLRQSPDVVVAYIGPATRANAHLVIECLATVGPHLLQPVQAEASFGSEIRSARSGAHLPGKVANADQHQRDNVTVRLDELQVVAGIPPSAR